MSRLDPSMKSEITSALLEQIGNVSSTGTTTSSSSCHRQYEDPVVIPAMKEHTATVIFLHVSDELPVNLLNLNYQGNFP